jgi:hypothetical protein
MNGKRGDHPLTDIFAHGLAVYGEPTDGYLRQIAELMPPPQMHAWFNDLWSLSPIELERAAESKLKELQNEAHERGWESP